MEEGNPLVATETEPGRGRDGTLRETPPRVSAQWDPKGLVSQ